ncbi:MAG: class I SAM-dependent methyltransferase [Calditrichia bacterium]
MSYQQDLAYVHHTGYGSFAENAARELISILQKYNIHNGQILDLGCGSGITSRIFTDAGYDVHGIDYSQDLIGLAKKNAPKATFQTASFYDCALPDSSAVVCLSECLNYLFDADAEKKLFALFQTIYESLPKNGVFICDVIEPGVNGKEALVRTYSKGEDWAILLEKEEFPRERMLERRMTIFRKTGELWRRSEETHRVRLYKSTTFAKLLRKANFSVRTVRGYGALRFRKGQVGFIARKR